MDAFNAADAQRHLQDVSEVSVRLLRTPCLIRRGAERLPRRTRQIFPRVTGSKPRTPLEDDVIIGLCLLAIARSSLRSSEIHTNEYPSTRGRATVDNLCLRWMFCCGVCCFSIAHLQFCFTTFLSFSFVRHPNAPTPHPRQSPRRTKKRNSLRPAND